MRVTRAQKVQVWPVDEEEFLLPRGFHSDRSDSEPDFEEALPEIMEDALDRLGGFGAGSALPAGWSLGGV